MPKKVRIMSPAERAKRARVAVLLKEIQKRTPNADSALHRARSNNLLALAKYAKKYRPKDFARFRETAIAQRLLALKKAGLEKHKKN